MSFEALPEHADGPIVRIVPLGSDGICDRAVQEGPEFGCAAQRDGQAGRQARLNLVGGRETDQQPMMHGGWVGKASDGIFESAFFAVVFVERDVVRETQDRQDAGEQRLFAPLDDHVGSDGHLAPAVELRPEVGDGPWHLRLGQRIDQHGEFRAPSGGEVDGV